MFAGLRLRTWALALGVIAGVRASDVLSSTGFALCPSQQQNLTISEFYVQYDRTTDILTFNVSGVSDISQHVTGQINVTALGQVRYTNNFDPCAYNISQLCPIPEGPFTAIGNITVPQNYASQIPSIAFTLPDLQGEVTLETITDDGVVAACLFAIIGNGNTVAQTSVTAVAVGIAGSALLLSGVSALGPHAGFHGVHFVDVMHWFNFIAYSGMYSVNYPPIYRSFSKNFGWSTGLVTWQGMQDSIDNFRAKTGGNLTDDNQQYLKNSTLVYDSSKMRKRDEVASIGNNITGGTDHFVSGVAAFAESLDIPSANTFMTVLFIFLIVLGAIAIGMMLFKLILELWSLSGTLSPRMEAIRKDYWLILSTTIVRVVLIAYGFWAVYCFWQFRAGDSWAADLLAAVTLATFTAVIAFFTIRIFYLAAKAKKLESGLNELYEHEPWARKYGFFYDSFKSNLWWFFIPILLMALIRAFFIVFANGHGLAQAVGIIVSEGIFLIVLFIHRPYHGRGANIINAMIAVVRVLSMVCLLIFVDELGVSQTTQTVTGVVLIAIQSTLTVVLACLIAASALSTCLSKRKPTKSMSNDNAVDPLAIPTGPAGEKGLGIYSGSPDTDKLDPLPDSTHRASTIVRDPLLGDSAPSTPRYEEYSSSYGDAFSQGYVRKASLGHGRVASYDSETPILYRPIPSPIVMEPESEPQFDREAKPESEEEKKE